MADHERIWLEPIGDFGRCWCQDNVWGDEATEYVRADLYAALEAENEWLRKALEQCQGALATLTEPSEISNVSVANAWAQCAEAEVAARRALEGGE